MLRQAPPWKPHFYGSAITHNAGSITSPSISHVELDWTLNFKLPVKQHTEISRWSSRFKAPSFRYRPPAWKTTPSPPSRCGAHSHGLIHALIAHPSRYIAKIEAAAASINSVLSTQSTQSHSASQSILRKDTFQVPALQTRMSSKRGGRGGRGGGPLPREVQVSKKMSWLLRHNAASQGLKLGPGGFVNVKDALNTQALKGLQVSFSELREIVTSNDKQRFSLKPVTEDENLDQEDPANFLIRANQGHSIKVEDDGLLTPVTLEDPSTLPKIVVHGTNHTAWPAILKAGGLKRMSRNHVHFASGLPEGFQTLEDDVDTILESLDLNDGKEGIPPPPAKADPVISGMRSTSTILIYLDLPAALQGGLKFGKSENGVILTEGDEKGVVPTQFFKRVEERRLGYGVIMKDGEVLKELPKHVTVGGGVGRGRGRGR